MLARSIWSDGGGSSIFPGVVEADSALAIEGPEQMRVRFYDVFLRPEIEMGFF